MKTSKLCLAVLLCFYTHAAFAQPTPHATVHDWHGVVASLRANGISPNSAPWHIINSACAPGASLDSPEFAECQFAKAMNYAEHKSDLRLCDAEARGAFPHALMDQPSIYRRPYLSQEQWLQLHYVELKAARTGYVGRCMAELGWKSADNYLIGKR